LRRIFKYDYGRQSLTAASYPLQVAFEWHAWRQLRRRIHGGDFDVVLRILPIVTVLPSPFAHFLRNGPIPFALGPLNGGLPWPVGFPQLEIQRQQPGWWVSRLRGCYRVLPFARSTYQKAAAIIAGSSHTFSELPPMGKSCSLFLEKTAWNLACFNAAKAFATAMNANFNSCLSGASFH
jgi:hypothetical protein